MDPTVAATGAVAKATDDFSAEAAKVTGNLLTRLLGPSADVVGQDWAERLRQNNLRRLLEKTQKRAEAQDDPGFTKPRLAAATFEVAQYADDEIVAEYLSGVLASSRAPGGGHDGGVAWSSLISRLSTDQLRLHYLIYASIRSAIIESTPARVNVAHSTDVMLPFAPILVALGIADRASTHRIGDAVDGLMREGLIDNTWGYSYGGLEHVQNSGRKYGSRLVAPYDAAFRASVSIHGIRLFMWGLGAGDGSVEEYINPKRDFTLVDDVDPNLRPLENSGIYAHFWVHD